MKYFFLLFLLFCTTEAFCQFQLKGRVVAGDSKTGLASASVFLSNTSVGTLTDSTGAFTLPVPAGKYDLIISFIGYETHAETLSGFPGHDLQIALKPKVEIFDEVVVGGYEKDGWEKWGKFFLESFIGTSDWAPDCTIKNQDNIRFRNVKKEHKLYAIATDQLVIENKALGYTVKYQLEDFEYDFQSGILLYYGYPLFTPMEGNQGKQNRWNKRREEAYYGSMMEFMRALYRNRIVEAGYEVRRMVKHPNEEKRRVREIYRMQAQRNSSKGISLSGSFPDSAGYYNEILGQPDESTTFSAYTLAGDSIAYALDSVTAGLEFDDYLYIRYTRADPPLSYRKLSRNNSQIASQIRLVERKTIQVQSSGNFSPPSNLISSGYWAWSEKMAHMLPFDYKPPPRDH